MARQTLKLRLGRDSALAPTADDAGKSAAEGQEREPLIALAIRRKGCLRGQYNGGEVVLQPSLLYREHDALFLLAVTARRDGKPPREPKLGTFRLAGLSALGLTDETFEPSALHRSYRVQAGWDLLVSLKP